MKSNDIDLHGSLYDDIENILDNHFFHNRPPFKIITGNSSKMKNNVLVFKYSQCSRYLYNSNLFLEK